MKMNVLRITYVFNLLFAFQSGKYCENITKIIKNVVILLINYIKKQKTCTKILGVSHI